MTRERAQLPLPVCVPRSGGLGPSENQELLVFKNSRNYSGTKFLEKSLVLHGIHDIRKSAREFSKKISQCPRLMFFPASVNAHSRISTSVYSIRAFLALTKYKKFHQISGIFLKLHSFLYIESIELCRVAQENILGHPNWAFSYLNLIYP